MSVKLISEKQATDLKEALIYAIKRTNNGEDINEAIAKEATAHGFNGEFANRMVEGFNTSKFVNHFSNASPEKRADSFAHANKDTVLGLMFKPKEKAASLRSSEFSIDFTRTSNLTPLHNTLVKTAEAKKPTEGDFSYRPSLDGSIKRAQTMLSNLDLVERDLTYEYAESKEEIINNVKLAANRLVDYNNPTSFEYFEVCMMSQLGEKQAQFLMDMVWRRKDFEELGEKRAEAAPTTAKFMPNDDYGKLMTSLVKSARRSSSAKVKLAAFQKNASIARTALTTRLTKAGIASDAAVASQEAAISSDLDLESD